ncbi:MAG: hypothetical protein WBP13_03860 [Methylophilaceae bacterium]
MFFKSALLSIAVAATLAGCASPMQQAEKQASINQANTPLETKITVPFNEKQAKEAMELGPTNIKGVLYHKVKNGGKNSGVDPLLALTPPVYLANVDVSLYPVTDHLLELIRLENENKKRNTLFSKEKQLRKYIPDPKIFKYSLATKTDESGRYFFKSLKPGRYYVLAQSQDIFTTGTETVANGASDVRDAWGYVGTVQHYRDQSFRVKTPVDYSEIIEVKSGQKELVLESRMRYN